MQKVVERKPGTLAARKTALAASRADELFLTVRRSWPAGGGDRAQEAHGQRRVGQQLDAADERHSLRWHEQHVFLRYALR